MMSWFLQEDFIAGILYFIVAALSLTSLVCLMVTSETNHATLVYKISTNMNKERRAETVE